MACEHDAGDARQRYLDTMGFELGLIYFVLRNECATLHWKWNELVALFGGTQERVDLLNSAAPAFFKLVQESIWEDILLHIVRMMDSPQSAGQSTVSLRRLPELVDSEIRSEVENLLELANQNCEIARNWRIRPIAHRELGLALNEDVAALTSSSKESVDDALMSIAALLNCLELHYCGGTVAYESFEPLGGAYALLGVLRDGLEARGADPSRDDS
jgi:hypothetical protein